MIIKRNKQPLFSQKKLKEYCNIKYRKNAVSIANINNPEKYFHERSDTI